MYSLELIVSPYVMSWDRICEPTERAVKANTTWGSGLDSSTSNNNNSKNVIATK